VIHREPELSGRSIIMLGSFNPQIFQPAWFSSQGLIREDEGENANIGIVHPEIVAFSTESIQLEAQRERLAISTKSDTDAPEIIRDLAISVLSLLSHTPIHSLGINTDGHYRADEREEFDRLRWVLAPPDVWGDSLRQPGLRVLTVQALRPDDRSGAIHATVEPSARFTPHAVYISVNDHFEVSPPGEAAIGARPAVEILTECWDDSHNRADAIVDQVLSLA